MRLEIIDMLVQPARDNAVDAGVVHVRTQTSHALLGSIPKRTGGTPRDVFQRLRSLLRQKSTCRSCHVSVRVEWATNRDVGPRQPCLNRDATAQNEKEMNCGAVSARGLAAACRTSSAQ